jgi:ribosomal protein S18 acetylase RimI-like enzyme
MSEPKLTIRACTAADAEAVARLWGEMAAQHKAYDDEVWCWSEEAPRHWGDAFLDLAEDPNMLLYAAEDTSAGELAAFTVASIKETAPIFSTTTNGFIWDLYVRDAYRRRGLGRRLMETVFAEMRRREVDDVILHVALANPAAVAFYESLGLRPVMYRMYKRF